LEQSCPVSRVVMDKSCSQYNDVVKLSNDVIRGDEGGRSEQTKKEEERIGEVKLTGWDSEKSTWTWIEREYNPSSDDNWIEVVNESRGIVNGRIEPEGEVMEPVIE